MRQASGQAEGILKDPDSSKSDSQARFPRMAGHPEKPKFEINFKCLTAILRFQNFFKSEQNPKKLNKMGKKPDY